MAKYYIDSACQYCELIKMSPAFVRFLLGATYMHFDPKLCFNRSASGSRPQTVLAALRTIGCARLRHARCMWSVSGVDARFNSYSSLAIPIKSLKTPHMPSIHYRGYEVFSLAIFYPYRYMYCTRIAILLMEQVLITPTYLELVSRIRASTILFDLHYRTW